MQRGAMLFAVESHKGRALLTQIVVLVTEAAAVRLFGSGHKNGEHSRRLNRTATFAALAC
jgi:hypothetical protein